MANLTYRRMAKTALRSSGYGARQRRGATSMRTRNLLAVFGLLLMLSVPAVAQVSPTTGAIRGTVADPSGAVVPKVTIVLINSNLAIHRETKTEEDGSYLFPLVPPASGYELDVSAQGFAKAVTQNIVVRVTEVATIPISLKIATQTNQVVVTTAVQTVDTSNPTTGNTLPEAVIDSMPLSTRDPLQLLATDAGVAADSDNLTIFAAGSRSTFNNYSMNGISSNNFEFDSLGSVPSPVPDSVQELRTETSLYDATIGRNSGAFISLVTRSGSQKIHGTVYEYNRNRAMAANDFFLNAAGIPAAPFVRNQFGGSVGGPLPDKKTFWFFNYDGVRESSGTSVNFFLPVLPAGRDAQSLATAFSVPVNAIDPVAVKYLNLPGQFGGQFWPSGTGAPVGTLGQFVDSASVTSNTDQMTARVDRDFQLFGGTNRLSVIAFRETDLFAEPSGLGVGISTGGQAFHYNNGNYSIEDTQILNPNLLNDFTVGYTNYTILGNNSVNPVTLSQVGMTRFNSSLYDQTPELDFSDQLGGFGTNQEAAPQQKPWTFSIRDMVSETHNKQTFRYGFEATRNAFNFNESYDFRGDLSFDPVFANSVYGPAACPPNASSQCGLSVANQENPGFNPADISFRDFLIGAPLGVSIASGVTSTAYRMTGMAAFFQDDYRVTKRLTLNLGGRWEYFGNITEDHGFISSFDPSRVSAANAQIGGPGILSGFLIPSNIPTFGTPGVNKSTMYHQDKLNFPPRIGFAYDVLGNAKLAVRGGYGMYFDVTSAISPLQTEDQTPFGLFLDNFGFNGTQILGNPFPTLPLPSQFPVFPTPAQLTGYDANNNPVFSNSNIFTLTALDPNNHTPYVEEWNLTTQYEFLPSWSLEVGYLGSHGQRLLNDLSLNGALLRNSANPAAFGLTTDSAANREARVPVVGLSEFSSTQIANAVSYYDALIVTVQHQFARGLFFKTAYTHSKSIDDDSAAFNFDVTGPPGNQFLPYLNKGLSDFDQPQRVVFTYVYKIPGPSRGFMHYAFGGWSIAGITTLNSGFPFTVTQDTFNNTLSGTNGYADVVQGCNPYLSGGLQGSFQYLNPGCFAATPTLTGGQTFGPVSPFEGPGNQMYTITADGPNCASQGVGCGLGQLQGLGGRNTVRGPFRQRWDVSLSKSFPIRQFGEAGAFELRGEVFQLFNHPVFANPQSSFGDPGFGQIFSMQDIPREIQVSGRIRF